MMDATPLQVIAHGFVPIPAGAGPVAGVVAEGVASVTRLGPGVTLILLDLGLPGGGTVALDDIRILITPRSAPGVATFPIAVDAVAIEAAPPPLGVGGTAITVKTWDVATVALIDAAYWFEVKRPVASETS